MTPPDAPEILALFRVLAVNPVLAERSMPWGGYLLGRKASLPLRDREIVILRVCARCGAEYEWGVHWAAFAQAAGLGAREREAIVSADARPRRARAARSAAGASWWTRCTTRPTSTTRSGRRWRRTGRSRSCIELLMLAGWYHAISYVCNAARVPLETWAARWRAE